jgi:hypothetical protein
MQLSTSCDCSFGNFGTSFAIGALSKSEAKLKQLNWAGTQVTGSAVTYFYYK